MHMVCTECVLSRGCVQGMCAIIFTGCAHMRMHRVCTGCAGCAGLRAGLAVHVGHTLAFFKKRLRPPNPVLHHLFPRGYWLLQCCQRLQLNGAGRVQAKCEQSVGSGSPGMCLRTGERATPQCQTQVLSILMALSAGVAGGLDRVDGTSVSLCRSGKPQISPRAPLPWNFFLVWWSSQIFLQH